MPLATSTASRAGQALPRHLRPRREKVIRRRTPPAPRPQRQGAYHDLGAGADAPHREGQALRPDHRQGLRRASGASRLGTVVPPAFARPAA
jgi:hypothetical protein